MASGTGFLLNTLTQHQHFKKISISELTSGHPYQSLLFQQLICLLFFFLVLQLHCQQPDEEIQGVKQQYME